MGTPAPITYRMATSGKKTQKNKHERDIRKTQDGKDGILSVLGRLLITPKNLKSYDSLEKYSQGGRGGGD